MRSRVIRVTTDVFREIRRRKLDPKDTPSTVIRRALGLPERPYPKVRLSKN